MTTQNRISAVVFGLLAACTVAAAAQQPNDTIRAGRYDLGRMWTFEYPPAELFSRTYGFTADSAWFASARLAALRIPGCSAALVSPNGLIVTNHHCARGSVSAVARPGETLLDSGFVAHRLEDERRIPNYYADQLLAALDVSEELDRAGSPSDTAGRRLRAEAGVAIAARLRQQYTSPGDSVWVQFVLLYNGARTSAYVFRRLTDIRLVAAAELQMGFFGGDWDNFTYPRYALDFAVLRAYGADGQPLHMDHWYRWGRGVEPGDAVFVIGNPGQTSRLTTISQLETQRDVGLPPVAAFLRSRLAVMHAWYEANRAEGDRIDIRNRMFGLSNTLKSLDGRLAALRDPGVLARRRDSERLLADSIRARPALRDRYGRLFDEMASLQREKARYAVPLAAFGQLPAGGAGSAVLARAYWTWLADHAASPDSARIYRDRAARPRPIHPQLERTFTRLSLADIGRAYGPNHRFSRSLPDSADAEALNDSAALALLAPMMPTVVEMNRALARINSRESDLAAQIGRARFEVYGASIPPDGSFSPRIADGVVQGYEYNGTYAPAYTTFYGLYDRYRGRAANPDWDLPLRWRTPPAGLDLGTPLDFVSTADTYGGNSGSPVVTKDLALVGLNFDRNVDALVRDYLYLPERGRNVMVDVRAIQAALHAVYGADRVVQELLTGRLFRTEDEARGGN